jgi:hypothetical protein
VPCAVGAFVGTLPHAVFSMPGCNE